MERGGGASAVLRHRNVRLFLAGRGISVFGDGMLDVALAFAVLELGGSASSVGLVLAAKTLPVVLTVLAGGVVADRLPRRAVMVAADGLRAVTYTALAVLLLTDRAEIWMLAALAAAGGVGQGFFGPASTGLLPDLVSDEQLAPVNGLAASATSAGEISGPLTAGIVVAVFSPGLAVAIDAFTFAASAGFLLSMRLGAPVARKGSSFLGDLRDGWSAFRSRRWVWTFVVYFSLSNLMWASWQSLGPLVADDRLGGPQAWGAILASIGVGSLIGSVIATRLDPPRPLVLVALCEGLLALPLGLLAVGANLAVMLPLGVLSGAGLVIGLASWDIALQRNIPPDALARVSSYDWFGSLASFPIGMALWGPISIAIGMTTALWVAFGSMVCFALILLAIPDTRALRRTAARCDESPHAATVADRAALAESP